MSSLIMRKLFSVDDYLQMAETGILAEDDRVELIRGEILAMSPIGPAHNAAIARATHALVDLAGTKAIVWIQNSTRLDDYSAPQPDIVLLKRRYDFYAARLPEPGDMLLIVEIADSSLEYDRKIKTALYAERGLPEYWISDIRNDRLLVFSEPDGKSYRARRELRRGDRIAPRLLPECELAVDALLP